MCSKHASAFALSMKQNEPESMKTLSPAWKPFHAWKPFWNDSWMKTLSCMIRTFRAWFVRENPLMRENPSMHENAFVHDSWMKTLSCLIRTFRAWFVHKNPSMHENPSCMIQTLYGGKPAPNALALYHEASLFRSSPFGSIQKVWKMFMNFFALILHSP